jgi:hypothetical protein
MRIKVKSASPEMPVEPFEIELVSGRVVSFVGYNATLKSLTARAVMHELCKTATKGARAQFINRLEARTENAARALRVEISNTPENALLYLADDQRLVLRAYFSSLERTISGLESYASSVAEGGARDAMLSLIDELKYSLAPQLEDYIEMKGFEDFDLLHMVLKVFDEKLENLSKQTAVDRDVLLPLDIEVAPHQCIVRDRRFKGKEVPLDLASTTVAAALLWKLTLRFFSIPASTRVLIVEEPEEAMTPLQQVAYVETLRGLAAEIPGENYVVLTTHSPYIAGVSDQPSYYFSYENGRFTCRPAAVAPPMTKADALLLVRTIES